MKPRWLTYADIERIIAKEQYAREQCDFVIPETSIEILCKQILNSYEEFAQLAERISRKEKEGDGPDPDPNAHMR